jgi:hypothetical protein
MKDWSGWWPSAPPDCSRQTPNCGEIEERRHTEAIIRLQRDLALTLSGKMGLQETLRLCVETAITISGLDSGGVYVVDPASGDLDLAYHQGLSPEFVQQGAYYEADALNTYLVMAGKPLYAFTNC